MYMCTCLCALIGGRICLYMYMLVYVNGWAYASMCVLVMGECVNDLVNLYRSVYRGIEMLADREREICTN